MDVVVETNVVFSGLHPFLRHRSVAGAWMVEAATEVEQRVHRGHMAVRAVVGGAFAVDVASGEDAREIFLGDGNGGVGLVVFEEYVVAGAVLLDEGVFEQKRIFFAVDDGVGDVPDFGNEHPRLAVLLVFVEIGRHATLEVLSLTDIDDGARIVVILVTSGLFGQIEHDAFQVLLDGVAFFSSHIKRKRCGDGASPHRKKKKSTDVDYSNSVSRVVMSARLPRNSRPFSPSIRSSMMKLT